MGFSGKQSARQKLASKALIKEYPWDHPVEGRQDVGLWESEGELYCSPSFFLYGPYSSSWVLDAQLGQGKVSFMLTNESLGLGCLEGGVTLDKEVFFRQVEAVTKESTYTREHFWCILSTWGVERTFDAFSAHGGWSTLMGHLGGSLQHLQGWMSVSVLSEEPLSWSQHFRAHRSWKGLSRWH